MKLRTIQDNISNSISHLNVLKLRLFYVVVVVAGDALHGDDLMTATNKK